MPISFPLSPTLNQTYTYNSVTWTYNGKGWTKSTTAASALPTQTNNSGKFLTTDGNTASWGTVTTTPADGSITAAKLTAGTDYMPMAVGTTDQRPASPIAGSMRINTTTNYLETYLNSAWVQISSIGLGKSSTNPATSVAQLRTNGITTDGIYWFSTSLSPTPFQAYVRFNYIDGGDWYLLLKVHSQGDMTSGSTYWTNTSTYNSSDFDLVSGTWAKYQTWNAFSFNRVMLEMKQGGVSKIPPIMIWTNPLSSFAAAITAAGTPANTSGLRCDSTEPPIAANATVANVTMKSGTAFTSTPGTEPIIQHYGIGCWANNSSNSTTAETFASIGRAGAWIGCPLDEQGHTFNNYAASGADSGFGFGCGAGNPAKTTSAGWGDWTAGASVNTLPGYVWIR